MDDKEFDDMIDVPKSEQKCATGKGKVGGIYRPENAEARKALTDGFAKLRADFMDLQDPEIKAAERKGAERMLNIVRENLKVTKFEDAPEGSYTINENKIWQAWEKENT